MNVLSIFISRKRIFQGLFKDKCIYLAIAVTTFYNVCSNNKIEHVVACLSYKRCISKSQQSMVFQFGSVGSIYFCSHFVKACICLDAAVTILYNMHISSKVENVAACLTYTMCPEIISWSIVFYFVPKGRFWLGTCVVHKYINVDVIVIVMYHATLPVMAKFRMVDPFQHTRCVQ